jgi:hypothetical protein
MHTIPGSVPSSPGRTVSRSAAQERKSGDTCEAAASDVRVAGGLVVGCEDWGDIVRRDCT